MMYGLRRLISKIAALVLLAGAVLGLYALVVAPFAGRLQEARERIGEQRQLLGRFTVAAGDDGRARAIEQQAKSGAGGAVYLPGASDAVRIAELQSRVGRIAEAVGIEIRSTRSLAAREQDGVRLIGVEAQMSTTLAQLQKLLHALESGRPVLFVETLQITPPAIMDSDNPMAATVLEVRLGLLGAAARKG